MIKIGVYRRILFFVCEKRIAILIILMKTIFFSLPFAFWMTLSKCPRSICQHRTKWKFRLSFSFHFFPFQFHSCIPKIRILSKQLLTILAFFIIPIHSQNGRDDQNEISDNILLRNHFRPQLSYDIIVSWFIIIVNKAKLFHNFQILNIR